jgi:peptide chain release factor 1
VLEISGAGVEQLDHEAGGHRIQRVPANERRSRVHTSTVTVAVLDPTSDFTVFPDADFRVEWYSGTGKGGQHRNRHQNSCRITHIPSGLSRKAETRSRQNSHAEAMGALLEALRDQEQQARAGEQNALRRCQVGAGMRGDKRRTYRFQDDEVVDHVTGRSARCRDIMRGGFDALWQQGK